MAKTKQLLKCETNTERMGDEVLDAFRGEEGGIHDEHVQSVFEHGQWYINCTACGAQWAVNDAEGGAAVCGFDFEQISDGDESCMDAARDEEENEEEEDEDVVTKQEAVEGCYYGDADVCDGELWECETCHQQYCESHYHETDKGRNVECVACERERKETDGEE
jgi:hypothetical protein